MATSQSMNVGSALTAGAAAASRSTFELRFNQLQNTLIRRLNKQIDAVNTTPRTVERKLEGYAKDNKELGEKLSVLQNYSTGVKNLQSQLEKFRDQIGELLRSLGSDDTVDQSDVDAFNEKKATLRETLYNMPIFKYEGMIDGDVIERLKDELGTVDSMTAVVGTVADNQDLAFSILELDDKASTGQSVMSTTQTNVANLQQDMQAKIASNQAEITEVNSVEQAKKTKEVEDLKARYAAVLQSISLSYENNQSAVETLNSYLSPWQPPKGSVLNLFS